jgi:hypothetical protein
MPKVVRIKLIYNNAYVDDDVIGYSSSAIEVLKDGVKIFSERATENEYSYFHRNLNDPADVADLIDRLLYDDPNYSIEIESILEED